MENETIVVTGAAGFIGSCMVNKLNNKGFTKIVAVDDFSRPDKQKNLSGKMIADMVHRDDFFSWLATNHGAVGAVYHLGARTDTTETDVSLFNRLNLNYSKAMFEACTQHAIPLVYASSAATYGSGEQGYADDHQLIPNLKPLNPYGDSKQQFDLWVMQQEQTPPFWAGMKFFNVYGPNEYHKGRMASVILHAHKQIREKGQVTLFRSHRPDFKDGEQLRDFIYVKDVVSVLLYLMSAQPESGIYNLGSGVARSFKDLALASFSAMGVSPDIIYVDTPEDIREKYQYYTCARMLKLLDTGYQIPFYSLEEGVFDYMGTYLESGNYY
jgi:ADP-L-glycero-D-manno-heptose 6-epimerase